MVVVTKKCKPLPKVVADGALIPSAVAESGTDKKNHAKPLPVPNELSGLRRLRVGHLMSLMTFSHQTVYARLRTGTIPPPDGKDGRRLFWKASTIREFLDR